MAKATYIPTKAPIVVNKDSFNVLSHACMYYRVVHFWELDIVYFLLD
jgi:hypothetical protein